MALGLLEQRQEADDLALDNFLLDILKDGSLLCRLLNRLKPSTINKVSQQKIFLQASRFCHVNEQCSKILCPLVDVPQIYQERVTEEQRLENIRLFLSACQELQLKDDEV